MDEFDQKMEISEQPQEEIVEKIPGRDVYETVSSLVSALLVVVLVFTFLVRLMGVSGPSMIPTLQDGDRLLVVNSLLCGDYQVGDIVIARKETFDSKPIVKRVIATHVGMTPEVGQQHTEGTLEVNLLPQGTLAECIRAAGAGLGGVLTPDEETQADSYASQLMEQNGDLYKANGIGLDTLKRFERILIKSNDLLEMCYGTDGEAPVSDAELTSHLEDEMVYIRYVVVPLYNTSTFAFADNDQSAQMLELAQTAAESCNAATPDGASAQTSAFSAAVAAALPDIYAVLDSEPSSDASSLSTALLGSDNIDATFSEEGTADAVRALKPGEAAAVQYSSYALMMLVRLDPLDADTLDSLRAQALSDMKSGELQDSIQSYGAQLPHALDSAAMKKMPASKIKNEK